MQAGELVPAEVPATSSRPARSPGCWVLFSCPRTVRHAELLAKHGHAPDTVIQVVLDEDSIDQDKPVAARCEQLPQILAELRLRVAPVGAFYHASDAFHVLPQSSSLEELAADLQAIVVSAGK